MHKKAKSRQEGFTLIELTITLTLIALLASAVIYSWRNVKQKALVSQGVEGARCLQSALIGLDALEPAEQDTMTQKLSGASLADFNAAAEDLGCKLGPTSGSPNARPVVIPENCIVSICQIHFNQVIPIRNEPCSTFDSRSLRPHEFVCGRGLLLRMPEAPIYRIHMSSEDSIRVERVSAPPTP